MTGNETERKDAYTIRDFLYGILLLSVPFVSATAGAYKESALLLVLWILACMAAVAVAYRFFCTRCPHYGNSGGKTRCIFFWAVPAFFNPQPGSYGKRDLAFSATAAVVIVALPLTWLRMHPSLLMVYVLSAAVAAFSIRRLECHRCIHRHCPLNTAKPVGSGQ